MTYYVVGLIGYAVKGFSLGGLKLSPELAMAISIPVVAALVWFSLRGMRKSPASEEG